MSEAFQYVQELADEIGPRPATTDAEAEAADYIEDVMRAQGLEVERQEFVTPRTYSWAYAIYHLLTVGAAVASGWLPVLAWPSFAVAAIVAFLLYMDLDTRFGLTTIMPKGPSQNVIGRHIPRARRGERLKRVVIVAHYDSAKASIAFSPGMVKNFNLTFGMMKWMTWLTPVLILAGAVTYTEPLDPWLWYGTMAFTAYLVIPLLINAHRELFMQATPGANDNASGVAAMLGVMRQIVPEPEGDVSAATQPLRRVPRAAEEMPAAESAPSVPEQPMEGGLLSYSPAHVETSEDTQLPDDFQWADTPAASPGQASFELDTVEFEAVRPEALSAGYEPGAAYGHDEPAAPSPGVRTPAPAPTGTWGDVDTDFDGDGIADEQEEPVSPAYASAPTGTSPATTVTWGDVDTDFDGDGMPDARPSGPVESGPDSDEDERRRELFGTAEQQAGADRGRERAESRPKRGGGLWSRIRRRDKADGEEVSSWLGVKGDFDARKEGRNIGSWENFEEEEDDFGFKGGWAGDDPIGDPDFASNEAYRIRKRVTESIDRALAEKEVWFVATGAEEVGTVGMKALLEQYGEELRGALIINLDNIGTGSLNWVTEEGMARRYHCDRRLASTARRVTSELELAVRPRPYRGLSTDATPALARGYKAMSIMAFDINGRLPNWHWPTDTTENVRPENIETAVSLVTGIVREI